MAKHSRIKIGDWTVEPAVNQLQHGDRVVEVGPKVMRVLTYLAKHADQVVSTEALIADVWEGSAVSDRAVSSAISQLRQAFEDDRHHPRYVQTVPKRGYRLIAPVSRSDSRAPTPRHVLPRVIVAALAAGVLLIVSISAIVALREPTSQQAEPPRQTLAVLPFDSLSAGLDNANLAIAIRNDLLANLTKISALRVISRPSNSVYQNDQQNSTEIGNDLDSTVILEGSIQRSGNTVRINVQLIDANTAEHLWAEIYQRELTVENVFGLQSEMAASIASALEATLLPDELDRLNVVPTLNARAYEFYLTGIDYLSRLDHRQFTPLAVQQLQRAVAEDSAFAQAWAELARARLRLVFFDLGEDEAQLPLAQQAVEQALTLAPDAGEPYLALAWYHYMGEQDFSAALEALAVAEERLPGSAEVLLTKAYVHRREGNWEQELANIEQAMDLDPQNFSLVHESFSVNGRLRNYEKAQADLERLLEFAPDNARYRQVEAMFSMQRDGDFAALKAAAASLEPLADRAFLGWQAALYERDYELAIRYLDVWKFEAPELEGRPWERQSMYGIAYTLAGRPDLGTAEFLNARAQIEDALNAASDDAELHVDLGEVLAWTGEREAAERLALRAIDLAQSGDALHARRVQGNAIIRVLGPAGARASTVEMLDEHLQQGPWSIEGLLPDPRLDPVRDDAGFRALVSRHRRQ